MANYTLIKDGDPTEQGYYETLIAKYFPSYEVFWQKFVTPLSQRPANFRFKDDQQLEASGKTDHDVCLAQLHYSILLHLIRAYKLLQQSPVLSDHLLFGLTALCGAQDIAFELLERFQNPREYPPWPVQKAGATTDDAGKRARHKWQQKHNWPLQHVRKYRNQLIHGRMSPSMLHADEQNVLVQSFPRIGLESKYSDWRKVSGPPMNAAIFATDFEPAQNILGSAWDETTEYLEDSWKAYLLPGLD
jgi:hypothetical protein